MRIFTIIVLLLIQSNVFSQLVEYSPVFINGCSGKIETGWWYIVDENDNKIQKESDTVLLNLNKVYFFVAFDLKSEPVKINQSKSIVRPDTFLIEKLNFKYPEGFFTWNADYYSCDSLINGVYVEYYYTGGLRYKGDFINGKIKDTLRRYFRTGELKSIDIATNKTRIFKEYYKNGQIRTDIDTIKRFRHYYYESGALESKMNNQKFLDYNYYENGDLKAVSKLKKEKVYYPNGKLKKTLKIKTIRIKHKYGDKEILYDYFWSEFDTLGNLTRTVRFSHRNHYSVYTGFVYTLMKNNYNRITYYENNKKKVIIYADLCDDQFGNKKNCWSVVKYKSKNDFTSEQFEFKKINKLIDFYDSLYNVK